MDSKVDEPQGTEMSTSVLCEAGFGWDGVLYVCTPRLHTPRQMQRRQPKWERVIRLEQVLCRMVCQSRNNPIPLPARSSLQGLGHALLASTRRVHIPCITVVWLPPWASGRFNPHFCFPLNNEHTSVRALFCLWVLLLRYWYEQYTRAHAHNICSSVCSHLSA